MLKGLQLTSRLRQFATKPFAGIVIRHNPLLSTQSPTNVAPPAAPRRNISLSPLFHDPSFYTALGMAGGVVSYTWNEHLRRNEILIQAAKSILEDLKKCYEAASKVTFMTELAIGETKEGASPLAFTTEQRLSFASFCEMQYRVVLAADTRFTNPKLRHAVEDNFNDFIKTAFSPKFNTDPELQKAIVGYYFFLHQLIIGYEKSLSDFIANIDSSSVLGKTALQKIQEDQEMVIKRAEQVYRAEILPKSVADVFKNLTNIFRQRHFHDAENQYRPKNKPR